MEKCEREKKQQYYEVRAFPDRKDRYNFFIENKIVCLGWPKIGDIQYLRDDKDRQNKIKKLLLKYYDVDFKNKGPYLAQVATFFTRFLDMKHGDIILIPYNKKSIVTIATVNSLYKYNGSTEFIQKHMAHQVSIENIIDVGTDNISKSLTNRLRAQLTLTRIDEDKHDEIDKLYSKEQTDNRELDSCINNIKTVEKSFNKIIIQSQGDVDIDAQLILKSLLLSAFSLLEGYLKDIIEDKVLKIKEETKKDKRTIVELGYDQLEKKQINARGWDSKINLFKQLFEAGIKNNKHIDKINKRTEIRNTLAHDITSVTISEDYNFIDIGENNNIYIGDIFQLLINCAEEINNIKLAVKL